MRGRYFLDEIDGITYSTNSYELWNLYDKLFFEQIQEIEHIPIEHPFECKAMDDHNSFLKGLEQEKQRYADGYKYVLEWVRRRGKIHKKGRWIKEMKI
jgi:hypothetical protein